MDDRAFGALTALQRLFLALDKMATQFFPTYTPPDFPL